MSLDSPFDILQEIGELLFADAGHCEVFQDINHGAILRIMTLANHLAWVWLSTPACFASRIVLFDLVQLQLFELGVIKFFLFVLALRVSLFNKVLRRWHLLGLNNLVEEPVHVEFALFKDVEQLPALGKLSKLFGNIKGVAAAGRTRIFACRYCYWPVILLFLRLLR